MTNFHCHPEFSILINSKVSKDSHISLVGINSLITATIMKELKLRHFFRVARTICRFY